MRLIAGDLLLWNLAQPLEQSVFEVQDADMSTFDDTWIKIQQNAGRQFHTKTGLPFTYRVDGSSVTPDRTGYPLHVSQFRKAFELMPLAGPGEINRVVRGPAYIFAILTDPRTRP
jgi:hypothetical protein